MYPQGHARANADELTALLDHKCRLLATPAVEDVSELVTRFTKLASKSVAEIENLYEFQIRGVA
jgi:hypothetical protein